MACACVIKRLSLAESSVSYNMGYPEKSALGPSLQLPPISTFASGYFMHFLMFGRLTCFGLVQPGYALDQRHFNGLSAVAAAAAAVEPMAVSTGTTSSSGSSAGASPVAGVPAYLRAVEPQRSSSAPLLLPNSGRKCALFFLVPPMLN